MRSMRRGKKRMRRKKKKEQEMNSGLETGVELSGAKMGLFMRFQNLRCRFDC